jgi:hypothetical protein
MAAWLDLGLCADLVRGQYFETSVAAVANSASYGVSGQNGYGITRGSLFVAFGQNLGPYQVQQAQSFPLSTTLAGTSVQVTIGGTSRDALMIYSLSGQIAAVLTYNTQSSPPVPLTVVQSAFGTYAFLGASPILLLADHTILSALIMVIRILQQEGFRLNIYHSVICQKHIFVA